MADIRREVGDVSPNTFIQQGVVDRSVATTLGSVGSTVMTVDSALARQRLDEAQEMLRAQYVVGSPAAGALAATGEESSTDEIPLSPEDNRRLKDFESILNTHVKAKEQGRMNYDSYMLRAERLLRVAIAKRPGLADDFRRIAATHTGSYEVGFLKSTEQALLEDAAKGAKAEQDLRQKNFELQQKELIENGFGAALAFKSPDDPGWSEYLAEVFPYYNRRVVAGAEVRMAEQAGTLRNLSKEQNSAAQATLWTKHVNQALTAAYPAIEDIRNQIVSKGLAKDPAAIRTAIGAAKSQLDQQISELEVAGSNGVVPSEVFSANMQRLYDMRKQIEYVISGASDTELVAKWNDYLTGVAKTTLYESSDEYLMQRTILNDLPENVALNVQKTFEKSLLMSVQEMLQNTGSPAKHAEQSAMLVRDSMTSFLPDGGGTTPDPVAVSKMADWFVNAGTSFLVQPETTFRSDQFTYNPDTQKAGFVKELNSYMPTIVKTVPAEKRGEIAAVVAQAAAHQTRLLAAQLFAKAPGLKGKIEANYANKDGALYSPKAGVTLTPTEQKLLAQTNRQAALPMIRTVIAGLTGMKADRVPQFINEAYGSSQQVAQAAQRAQESRQGGRQGGGSSGVGDGRTAPPAPPKPGDVVKGWRFKGGDPSQRSSWEPAG